MSDDETPKAEPETPATELVETEQTAADEPTGQPPAGREIGGPKGPEPTRYGDWEQKGRCTDF
ncbi:DUF1674 domain-containing protein [Roseospirillum parvum]|uniref:DUF1674 domain-containing protein n=1 Tax=Roseospirillum parvum TaxID=83401 RepID=A0A1G7ZQ35_9PROT|nr:succinate dehydrogenase assembly factor 4 [Roseospirillum parvum]SDH10666.1 Protein of unknown function [Roseospirillum parvum]